MTATATTLQGPEGKSILCPLVLRVRAAGLVYEDAVEWEVGAGGDDDDGPVEAFAMRTVADLGACIALRPPVLIWMDD